MSRLIKFRVWCILSKKMRPWGEIFDLPAWEIFPGTPEQRAFNVMQYTGINDKNGVEIYEGDLIQQNNFNGEEYTAISQVVFDQDSYCLKMLKGNAKAMRSGLYAFSLEATPGANKLKKGCVIGNIHENPELLEDK